MNYFIFFHSSRIGLPPGATEAREIAEIEETRAASPPLELRRTTSMPLQSPSDRITGKLKNYFIVTILY